MRSAVVYVDSMDAVKTEAGDIIISEVHVGPRLIINVYLKY